MIDITQGVDNFLKANANKSLMFSYYAYKIPAIIVQMLPVSTLIGVIIMFSLMKKNNELIALKACGVRVWKISQPVIITSFCLSVAVFLFSEIVVPYTSSKSNEIWRVDVEKKRARFYGQNRIWYKGDDCIYWIKRFDTEKMIIFEPDFYFFDPSFHLIKKVNGRIGMWKDHKWEIKDGCIMEAKDNGDYSFSKFKQICFDLPQTPEDFIRETIEPEEMNYWQLRRHAEILKKEGLDASSHQVDMNIKLAFPMLTSIMVLIGIPISLRTDKGGTPMCVSLGIVACFLYLMSLGVSRSLGLSGIFPPIFSAWLANGIFFLIGIYLMMDAD